MENQILCSKEIELDNQKYTAYLKRVATRLENGLPAATTLRAFIKKV